MKILFDQPGKVVEVGGRAHIVLVSQVREAIRGDCILRNPNGDKVGKIVGYGVDHLRKVWVEIEELPAPQS